jgi:uncharacterized protein
LNARSLLYAADGRYQPPWRIVFFLVLTSLFTAVAVMLVRPFAASLNRLLPVGGISETLAFTAGALAATAVLLRWVDKRPWSMVWLDRNAARPSLLGFGFFVGAAPIALVSMALLAAGLMMWIPTYEGSWLVAALKVSLVLLPAALIEELISRGYIFSTLGQWIGWPAATAVTSIAFGLLHLGNPNTTALPIFTVIMAGVYLAVIVLVTRSLYAAWVAHFAWNWVMAVPLHIAVSGVSVPRPDYGLVETGPDWITGGLWGPEGGVGAVLGMGAGLAYLKWRTRKPDEQR